MRRLSLGERRDLVDSSYPPLTVKAWGDFACFTRPEFKVERVSYEVMTPSGARGLLEAIFWKPEIEWRVREIHVLKPIRHFSLLRNETSRRASRDDGFNVTEFRTQRNTLALRDVAYVIKADVVVKDGVNAPVEKYRDQFRRRVDEGACFHHPYLGCREFAASFGKPGPDDAPLDLSDDLGRMLFDMEYGSTAIQPRFFSARLERGVLVIPDSLYERGNA
jgi:CRISPR-associated protein Cas5d